MLTPHGALGQSVGQSSVHQNPPLVQLVLESITSDQPSPTTALRGTPIVPFAIDLLGDTESAKLLNGESTEAESVQPELPTE